MLKKELEKVIREIFDDFEEDETFLLSRKEISEAIGCTVDTFDNEYRYLDGFPYHKKGNHEAWNKKEVFEFLHKNKLVR